MTDHVSALSMTLTYIERHFGYAFSSVFSSHFIKG